jgi:rod shape-determining protein MreC
MKSSVIEGRTLNIRVMLFILASLILMITDHRFEYLQTVRTHLLTLVYPIQYLVNLPLKTGQWLSINANNRIKLLEENAKLHEENIRLKVGLQKYQHLKKENKRLRQLLHSSTKLGERVMLAEILAVELDSAKRDITINKGSKHGVFMNQPVIDAQGIIGQVTHVGMFSSIVMLITDYNHQLPVQIERTGLRTVAKGMGTVNRLSLLYISNIGLTDGIKVGDLLVTSGFGDKFPKGYPVGIVIDVTPDIGKPYAQVQASPLAKLEQNNEVLLVWKTKSQNQQPINNIKDNNNQ